MTTAAFDQAAGLPIQEVARRTGFSEPTLRYYERIGLIAPVPRDQSGSHRRYASETVDWRLWRAAVDGHEHPGHARLPRAKVALWQARADGSKEAEQKAAAGVLRVMKQLRDCDREGHR
jgi:hypothetical protein